MDALLFAVLLSQGLLVAMRVLSARALDGQMTGACFRAATCREMLSAVMQRREADSHWLADARFWMLALDHLFVVAYTAAFLITFVLVARPKRSSATPGRDTACLVALCVLALATAAADCWENIALLGAVMAPGAVDAAARTLAPVTAAKFWLAALCLLIALPSLVPISRSFRARWGLSRRPPA